MHVGVDLLITSRSFRTADIINGTFSRIDCVLTFPQHSIRLELCTGRVLYAHAWSRAQCAVRGVYIIIHQILAT